MGLLTTIEGGEDGILHNFGEPWLAAFKQTEAFHVWNSCTDAALFDIIEPKCALGQAFDPLS
jgi:hypothetical protein